MEAGQTLNYVYDAQVFEVTEEWSEQTIVVAPDSSGWTFLVRPQAIPATKWATHGLLLDSL